MATVKKGILSRAGEWWVHLRPYGKREFWGRERRAVRDDIAERIADIDVDAITARYDQIIKHQPRCPSCYSEQVQIRNAEVPARWRCRSCKTLFTSEPGYDWGRV